jgi:methyl-accepting chemotaxis protein
MVLELLTFPGRVAHGVEHIARAAEDIARAAEDIARAAEDIARAALPVRDDVSAIREDSHVVTTQASLLLARAERIDARLALADEHVQETGGRIDAVRREVVELRGQLGRLEALVRDRVPDVKPGDGDEPGPLRRAADALTGS